MWESTMNAVKRCPRDVSRPRRLQNVGSSRSVLVLWVYTRYTDTQTHARDRAWPSWAPATWSILHPRTTVQYGHTMTGRALQNDHGRPDHACGRHAHDSTHCSHSTRPVPHAPTPSATRAVTAVQSTDTPPRRRRRACAAQRSHMRPARSHARSGCSRCAG